jgi:chemotaxis protein CheZ
MRAQRKTFRIEALTGNSRPARTSGPMAVGSPVGEPGLAAVMAELQALRALIEPSDMVTQKQVEAYRAEMAEAQKLKAELDSIYSAIADTKKEIATLHVTGFNGPEMTRVTHELDAIVDGTANATDSILSAAEEIDQLAANLAASLKGGPAGEQATEIGERVVAIFEACNFQDLTGQRITKVVNTLKFIEGRIVKMMDIWGGIESFRDVEAEAIAERDGDAKLLNGPKLKDEVGHVNQDDIDALFS